MGEKGPVLVLMGIEGRKKPSGVDIETLHAAGQISGALKTTVHVLILGNEIDLAVEEILHYSPEAVHAVDESLLENYHPEYYLAAFHQAYDEIQPCAIVMGHTLQAIDLTPRIAFDLDAGLITDCTGINADSGEVIFFKPVFSSHVLAGYAAGSPFIVTVRSKAFEPAQQRDVKQGKVNKLKVKLDGLKVQTVVAGRAVQEQAGIRVEDAEIIVAGGRGIGGGEGFVKLSELADALGAALGASRPPVDQGWVTAESQVGQTGAIVAPKAYIAIGISGAIQHLAGMAQSKRIIAVNKDAEANIFKVADYGVVGMYEEIVPAFTQAVRGNRKD
jgi:electron transfer flavoprotein alpha subunit